MSNDDIKNGDYCVNGFFPTQVIRKVSNAGHVGVFEPVCICNGTDAKKMALEITRALEFFKNNKIQ